MGEDEEGVLLDIYSKVPIAVMSAEHILLNCLGGRLSSRNLIDKTTNDVFGDTIDKAVAKMIEFPRVVLGAMSGDGVAPRALTGLETKSGEPIKLLSGGKPELAHPKISCEKIDGKVVIHGVARNVAELVRLTERIREKHNIKLEAVLQGAISSKRYVGLVQGDVVYDNDCARGIAKMACNLFAMKNRVTFLDADFEPIRNFVVKGDGVARDFVRVNVRPVQCNKRGQALGELDHVLVVRRNIKSGLVEALVCLYGHLQFAIHLGRTHKEVLAAAYRVDQLGRDHRTDHARDMKVTLRSFSALSRCSDQDEMNEWAAALRRMLGIVVERQESDWESRMLDECMAAAWGPPDGRTITEEMANEFAALVAERFVNESPRMRYLRE